MKIFRYALVAGWVAFFGIVALLFAFPKAVGEILAPVAGFFALPPAVMLVATLLYGIVCVYRAGMEKAGKTGGAKPPTEDIHHG